LGVIERARLLVERHRFRIVVRRTLAEVVDDAELEAAARVAVLARALEQGERFRGILREALALVVPDALVDAAHLVSERARARVVLHRFRRVGGDAVAAIVFRAEREARVRGRAVVNGEGGAEREREDDHHEYSSGGLRTAAIFTVTASNAWR